MKIEEHNINGLNTAEVISNEIIIHTVDDALNLLGNLFYQGYEKMIVHEQNITPYFFDLKTKLAGEILQKFTQYKMPLIIVGDFSSYSSKSLKDFIYESNKGKQVNFRSSIKEILK